jgi:hypothetical protein
MKIAIVGAGIFGITIGLKLSKFFDVTIFESKSEILGCASRTNQLRLHRGYHYPRSPETVSTLIRSIDFFREEYSECIIDDFKHYYCIANKDSKVSPVRYLNFCKSFGLKHEVIKDFDIINQKKIDLTILAEESLIDYQKLLEVCNKRIKSSKLKIMLNTMFSKKDVNNFEIILNCTYADINFILEEKEKKEYQFELCEKILVKPPVSLKKKSIVIMDGPFMCIDPYGRTGNSLLGNVVHAIHSSNKGFHPIVPKKYKSFLNKGVIECKEISAFKSFISSGKEYIKDLEMCEYLGSMFTIRSVLPNVDKTDERPTIVSSVNKKIINVFSGKIDTCSLTSKIVYNQILENLNKL